MASSLRILAALFLLSAFPLFASIAEAAPVGGLQAKFSPEIDAPLREDILATIDEIFAGSSRFEWIPVSEARARLDSDFLDCFTEDCLRQVGEELDSSMGLRIRVDVDAEVYNWSLTFYDLAAGEPLLTETGACELCGRAEVLQQFEASLRVPLVALRPADRQGSPPLRSDDSQIPAGSSMVRISVIPEDTRIFIDDSPVGHGTAEVTLPEGTYEVRFSHDTHRGLRETLIISESSPRTLFLRVHLSRPARFQDTTLMTRGDGLVDHIEPNRVPIGATAVGAGAVVILTSYFVGRLHGRPACPGDTPISRCDELYNTAGLSTFLTTIGGVSIAGGAVLLTWPLLAGTFRDLPDDPTALSLSPSIGGDYAGFSLFRRF